MSVKHEYTLNPVTALEFFTCPAGRQLVLAGEGCHLKIFEADTSNLICQYQVFKDQTIHGIAVRNDATADADLQVVIWGGSSLTLLRTAQVEDLLSQDVGSIIQWANVSSDWILDVAISPYDTKSCVLVTAHNTVLQARFDGTSNDISLETLHSPSRSILYSAHLVWESPDTVLVAAGTVFGEIITWDCSLSPTGSSRVLATFTGHEGSIFGVHISPPTLDSTGTLTRLLASCSDDRTIRIRDIYGAVKGTDGTDRRPNLDLEAPRETGFGNNSQADGDQHTIERCLSMVMGHASRIWRVRFHISKPEVSELPTIHVLSFGEDSTAQLWELDFGSSQETVQAASNGSQQGTLRHLNTFAFHSGKHIWSTAMNQWGDSRDLLATGGADGKIAFYTILIKPVGDISSQPKSGISESLISSSAGTNELGTGPTSSCSWELKDILDGLPNVSDEGDHTLEQTPPEPIQDTPVPDSVDGKNPKKIKPKKIPKDAFNRYAFVSENEFLLTTTFGRVILGRLGESTSWGELYLPESGKMDLRSYSIVKGVPELALALLGGANGSIYLYQKSHDIEKVAQVEGKVADIFPISNGQACHLEFVITTLGTDTATLLSLDLKSSTAVVRSATLQLPHKFVVTTAGKTRDGLALGSRNGSLSMFNTGTVNDPVATWASTTSIPGDAITSITSLPDSEIDHKSYFLTTGRDGTYAIFAVESQTDTSTKLYPVHHGTPPLGSNIESAWFEGSDLLLYGFKSKNFIVWNETRQCEIMNVECGGAHRSYAYSAGQGGGGSFIYTKASKLYLHSQRSSSHKIMKSGGHGREIKACAVSTDWSLIATGAEDTTVRIWRYLDSPSPLGRNFESQAVVQKHSAGIQALQFHGSKYLFSSGGNEEFFVWALHEISGFGIGVVCEASCPDQSEERDLRIMGFDVSPLRGDSSKDLLISLAYSDSTIRCYRYSKALGFKSVAKGRYTSSCFMQIRHIQVSSNEFHLLTAATDGKLVIWKASLPDPSVSGEGNSPQQALRLSTHKLHQSAVKCLDFRESVSKEHIIVATGGDDNAVGVTLYSSTNLDAKPRSIILRFAHAAAITGLTIFPSTHIQDGVEEEVRIVSSSNDQRVKEWIVSIGDDGAMRMRKVGDVFTSVADVGDLAVLRDAASIAEGEDVRRGKVLVVGNGMEVFAVSGDN